MRYYHIIFFIQLSLVAIWLTTFPIVVNESELDKLTQEQARVLLIIALSGLISGVTIPITVFLLPNIKSSLWTKANSKGEKNE